MLEEKIEKNLIGRIGGAVKRNFGVYLLASGLALGGMYGCEEEPKGPSHDCCVELDCNPGQTCEGDGDDCYCKVPIDNHK